MEGHYRILKQEVPHPSLASFYRAHLVLVLEIFLWKAVTILFTAHGYPIYRNVACSCDKAHVLWSDNVNLFTLDN